MCAYSGLVADAPASIVSFRSPPVAEVVTSVRFTPMPVETFLSIGTLHAEKWSHDFPDLEQQVHYEVPTETFPGPGARAMPFEISFPAPPPMPRIWAISSDGYELLQLQPNWFAANWRANAAQAQPAPGEGARYDRWTSRRRAFLRHWATLQEWLAAAKMDARPDQCEVTYINHLRPIEGLWANHGEIGKVLPGISPFVAPGLQPEQVTYRSTAAVSPDGDLPASRLHVVASPAFAATPAEPSPIVVLELTVRGAPGDGDLSRFYDRARKVIVESFVRLTSDEARAAWGQE